MRNVIIWIVVAIVVIIIVSIIVKERKRKANGETETIKEKLKALVNKAEPGPKVAESIEQSKPAAVNKVRFVSDETPAMGTRLYVSPKVSVAYSKPEAKKGNIIRAVRKDVAAGTFLGPVHEIGFVALIDDNENRIFMLSKDLYFIKK